jgi:hypothetical protein
MSDRLTALLLLAIAVVFVLYAATASAGSVTFAQVCSGATYRQVGADLQVWCPGNTKLPWLTYKGCARARVLRDGAGNVKVVCGAG